MSGIHPTAVVDPSAQLGAGVVVGPGAVVEADVVIGDNCELRAGAVIRRHTRMGAGNVVHAYAVLGGEPQDLKFDANSVTHLRIGSGNVFREYVTINRATKPGSATVIGDKCYFMTQSHVGHDCTLGDGVIMANNAAVGGHCQIGAGAFLSSNAGVHQFCWVGELVMMRGQSGVSQHVPPFVMVAGINFALGLNTVGLRRREQITPQDRLQLKAAYRLVYRSALTPRAALDEMDRQADWGAPAVAFREFVRRAINAPKPFDRGLISGRAARGLREEDSV